MCFSAGANFIGSAVLSTIGVPTLAEVKHRRELLFAAMPCLFAAHQFTEGFVWLGLDCNPPPIVAYDAALALYILWGLIAYPLKVSAARHGIVYLNRISTTTVVAILYVTATCGALFFSGFRALVLLGRLNLMGLLTVMTLRRYEFSSLWCAYAAVGSVIVYFFFRRSRSDRPSKYVLEAA